MSIIHYIALAALAVSVAAPVAANAGTFTTLFTFPGNERDGGNRTGQLLDDKRELYGTAAAYVDKLKGNGNVFTVNPATGAFRVVYRFRGGTDGTFPASGVIFQNGLLYGTTWFGGGPNCSYGGGCGTIISVNSATHTDTILYSFSNGARLSQAGAGALVSLSGAFYGTTGGQGARAQGSIFSINPTTGAFTTVYSFAGSAGASPKSHIAIQKRPLVWDDDGGRQRLCPVSWMRCPFFPSIPPPASKPCSTRLDRLRMAESLKAT